MMREPLYVEGDTFYLKTKVGSMTTGYYRILSAGVSVAVNAKLYANDLRMWSYKLIKIRKNGEWAASTRFRSMFGYSLLAFEKLVEEGILVEVKDIPTTKEPQKKEPNLSSVGTKDVELLDVSGKKLQVGQRVATTTAGDGNSLVIMKVLRLTDKKVVLSENGKTTTTRFPSQTSIIM